MTMANNMPVLVLDILTSYIDDHNRCAQISDHVLQVHIYINAPSPRHSRPGTLWHTHTHTHSLVFAALLISTRQSDLSCLFALS